MEFSSKEQKVIANAKRLVARGELGKIGLSLLVACILAMSCVCVATGVELWRDYRGFRDALQALGNAHVDSLPMLTVDMSTAHAEVQAGLSRLHGRVILMVFMVMVLLMVPASMRQARLTVKMAARLEELGEIEPPPAQG